MGIVRMGKAIINARIAGLHMAATRSEGVGWKNRCGQRFHPGALFPVVSTQPPGESKIG